MDMILNKRFEEPYSKFAPEGSLPILSKTLVKSRLSAKFWKCTEKIYEEINKQNQEQEKQVEELDENLLNQEEKNANDNNVSKKLKGKKEYEGAQVQEGENDIMKLKNLIAKLQNEIVKKDSIIQSQKEEKKRLNKRVDELEKMLSSFLVRNFINVYIGIGKSTISYFRYFFI